MKHVPIITSIALAVLAACSSNLNTNPVTTVSSPQQFLGLLEIRVSGIGDGGTPTSSARFIDPASLQSGLNTKAVKTVPVQGRNAIDDLEIIPRAVTFYDQDLPAPSQRYVTNMYDLVNRTTTLFNNLHLYAVSVPNVTLGGTAISRMVSASGTAITDVSKARAFKPAHGMRSTRVGLEVNTPTADMQLYPRLEVNNPSTSQGFPNGVGVQQQALAANILPAGGTVLDYGFVAANRNSGRAIVARNTATDCTIDACKGTLSLTYKFPRVSPRTSNPWAFSLYFVVANNTRSNVSQSLEEQEFGTFAGRLNTGVNGFAEARYLPNAFTPLLENGTPLCDGVRTAVGPDAFLGAGPVVSTAGSLDQCFGVNGKVTTPIDVGLSDDDVHALGIQADGKIVVAGSSYNSTSNGDFALARYNQNGSLDTTFDGDGKVITAIGSHSDSAFALGIDSDGKIVVAGESYNSSSNSDFAIARYDTNGSLDTTFDVDGKVTTAIGSTEATAFELGIQSDGKIVVAGRSNNGLSTSDFALARYNTNGSLDTAFGTGGKVTTATGSYNDIAYALGIQSDGKIVIAGTSSNGTSYDFALARYNP